MTASLGSAPEERRRGWHEHYAHVRAGHVFLRSVDELDVFDDSFFTDRLVERLSGDLGSPPDRHTLTGVAIRTANWIGLGRPLRAARRRYRIARRLSTETGG